MYRKTFIKLGFFCLLLMAVFPCASKAAEGVKPTVSHIPASATVPQAPGAADVSSTKIPIETPLAEIPVSANQEWEAVCVDRSLNLNGDIQTFSGDKGQWSVGPAVSTQLIKYDFGKKRAGVNTALGAGASFRFYQPIIIEDINSNPVGKPVYISDVKQACRQTSFGKNTKGYLAAPLLSITPTLYVSEPVDQDDLSVQPAILLGFLEDILSVGVGFNLTGPSGEKGNVFMLMSIGAGFNW